MTAWMVTWLWQGLALAATVVVFFKLVPRLNASTRHFLWWTALAGLIWLGYATAPSAGGVPATFAASREAPAPLASLVAIEVDPFPHWLLSGIVAIWLGVALIRLVRTIPAVRALHKLQDACVEFPQEIEERLSLWKNLRGKGRRARLVLCDRIEGPVVLGLLEPCIAVPPGLVRDLDARDLDQIVAHEYAHVRRHDDWLRLLQVLLEAALWIHPAAHWISHRISFERELACDTWVVSRTRAARSYARCLARAAELRIGRPRQQLLSTSLFGRQRHLMGRVEYLLSPRPAMSRQASLTMASIGICAIAATTGSLRMFPGVVERLVIDTLPVVSSPLVLDRVMPPASRLAVSQGVIAAPAVESRILQQPPAKEARQDAAPAVPGERALLPAVVASPPDVPAVVEGRPFRATYHAVSPPEAQLASLKDRSPRNGWSAAGTAIGSSARDASVGLAGVFSRASVSVARSFR